MPSRIAIRTVARLRSRSVISMSPVGVLSGCVAAGSLAAGDLVGVLVGGPLADVDVLLVDAVLVVVGRRPVEGAELVAAGRQELVVELVQRLVGGQLQVEVEPTDRPDAQF